MYLFTHYIKEEFMLSTWDIIEEHFGLMLVWGDMVYVPFWYSVVGWYLVDQKESIELSTAVIILAIHIFGHFIFRVSNWQKYVFKRYGKDSSFLGVKSKLLEDRLLVSGFWGIGRHLNYTGEIITYLTFALTSGAASVVPYILPISLLGLLT
jgi:delta14-sterol reductase